MIKLMQINIHSDDDHDNLFKILKQLVIGWLAGYSIMFITINMRMESSSDMGGTVAMNH